MKVHVHITYRDKKTETFKCTDYPSNSGGWITIYNNLDRTSIPDQAISRIECTLK